MINAKTTLCGKKAACGGYHEALCFSGIMRLCHSERTCLRIGADIALVRAVGYPGGGGETGGAEPGGLPL